MKRDFWRRVLDATAGPDRAIRRQLEAENLELGYRILKQKNELRGAAREIEQLRTAVDVATEAAEQFQERVLAQEREIERLRLIVDTLPYSPFKRDPRDKLLTKEDEQILRGESGHDGEQAPGGGGSPGRV